jgi:hypothetical protein
VTVVVAPSYNPTLNQYQITKVTVTQTNYAPNNTNGDVTVTVTNNRLTPQSRGVRPGPKAPVRSTRGQVR